MTNTKKGYLLACLDGSRFCDSVVEHAIWIAQSNQHPIKFLHTIEHSHRSEQAQHEGNLTPGIRKQLLEQLSEEERQRSKIQVAEGKQILARAAEKAEAAGITDFVATQRHGTLLQAVRDLEHETALIILGSKGEDHEHGERGLGAQLTEAIRAVHIPVFVTKKDFVQPKQLMFAYDGSETSKKALEIVKNYRFCYQNLNIHVVSVQKDIEHANELLQRAKVVFGEAGISIQTHALTGDVVRGLTHYHKEHSIDITAMGAFSHGKLHDFFFGSFTHQMLLKSDTHFLLVR